MRSQQDGQRCGCIWRCRLEEGCGIPIRNPIFHLWLDRLLFAIWLDPRDGCAADVPPRSAHPFPGRSRIPDTILRIDARPLVPLPARPSCPYVWASALPPDNPRSGAAILPLACPRWYPSPPLRIQSCPIHRPIHLWLRDGPQLERTSPSHPASAADDQTQKPSYPVLLDRAFLGRRICPPDGFAAVWLPL